MTDAGHRCCLEKRRPKTGCHTSSNDGQKWCLKFLCPYFLVVLLLTQIGGAVSMKKKLMVLLIDGLRWDYVNRNDLPGFKALFESGSRVHHLEPEFPTLCYPNFFSFVTGLFPESHGMIGNNVFDSVKQDYFRKSANNSSHWWEGGEPIWVTAQKQGKRSFLFHWPGCERTIRLTKPDYCRPYKSSPTMQEYMEAMVDAVKVLHNNSADFVGFFNEDLDKVGHRYGPNSPQLLHQLKEIDKTLLFLLEDLAEHGLRDSVNILVLSDHGMTDISMKRIIDLRRYISKGDIVQTLDGGPYTNIWPHQHVTQKVFDKLKNAHPNMTIYQKHTLPDIWHYKNSHRVAPLTAVADVGWYILTYVRGYVVYTEKKRPARGWHGYSSQEPDMWAMFAASGPDIAKNMSHPSIRIVDIYQMMCHLLGIQPAPHNGTWAHVEKMIQSSWRGVSYAASDSVNSVIRLPGNRGEQLSTNFCVLGLNVILWLLLFVS